MNRIVAFVAAPVLLSLALFHGTAAAWQVGPAQVDVFVSGTEGYHTFRIPALVVTRAGSVLAICEGRKTSRADHGDVDLVLKRSSDGGRTWGPLELVFEEGGDQNITIGNPCPVVDQETGVIWLPFTRNNNDVFITSSKDDGKTWSQPRRITSQVKKQNWNWYATGPGNAIQLERGPHRGRLIIPCDHRVNGIEDRRASSRSHVFFSDDHGKTWQLGGAADSKTNECAVVQLSDSTLMINMRSFRGRGKRAVALSRNAGLTWSAATDDATLIEPVCQASLIRYTWRDAEGKSRLLYSNPATKSGRHRMTVRLSYDEGQTWPISKVLHEGSAAYSSLAELPGGTIGLLYERDDYQKITFASFTLQWLTDGQDRLKTKDSALVSPRTTTRIVDLTHVFDRETIYWPTEAGFRLIRGPAGLTEKGYFYAANRFAAAEHGGTHMDAPIHFFRGRHTVDQIPLEKLVGEAAVVDVAASCAANRDYQIGVEDLRGWEITHNRQLVDVIVLLRTGFGRHWNNRLRYLGTDKTGPRAVAGLHFPGLAPEAARWLVEHRAIKAIGIDTPSIDYGQSQEFQSHVTLCKHNVPVFENVANLHELPTVGATVVALPMKIGGGSGAPLRIIAILAE